MNKNAPSATYWYQRLEVKIRGDCVLTFVLILIVILLLPFQIAFLTLLFENEDSFYPYSINNT